MTKTWTSENARTVSLAQCKVIVENAEHKAGKPCESFSREEWISLVFDRMGISRMSFFWMRAYLFEHLQDDKAKELVKRIDYADLNHTQVFEEEYFATYDDMMDYAQAGVAKTALKRSADVRVYDTTLAALTLAWLGFTIAEATNVQKDDLHPLLAKKKLPSGKYVPIPKRAYQLLSDYAQAVGVYERKNAVNVKPYKDTAYLLRTTRSEQLNPVAIRAGITRYIETAEKHITYDSTYWSGVFCRTHEYEQKYGELALPNRKNEPERNAFVAKLKVLLGEHFTSVDADLYARFNQYQAYKRAFYPNG